MKDASVIPKGDYCYTWVEHPSEKNNYRGEVKHCPYYGSKIIDGIEIPWCSYLDLGGTPGNGNWAGWEDYNKAAQILNNHFGGEKEADEKLSLMLLFDYCKECGENHGDENE